MKLITIFPRVLLVCILVLTISDSIYLVASASPAVDPGINKIYIDTLRDGAFTVSWTTDLASNGSVTWGASQPPSTTTLDSVSNTTTHFVVVSGLFPATTYYFKVNSADAYDDNGGAYYQVTTGPTLGLPSPGNIVWGYVYQSDGATVVPNAIVYLQLQDGNGMNPSQWVSARADASGVWNFQLANIRTLDSQAYYATVYGTSKLRIIGQGGYQGSLGVDPNPWIITTPTVNNYRIDVILNQAPTAVTFTTFLPVVRKSPLPVVMGSLSLGLVALLVYQYKNCQKSH